MASVEVEGVLVPVPEGVDGFDTTESLTGEGSFSGGAVT
jgi:hypothetical protein